MKVFLKIVLILAVVSLVSLRIEKESLAVVVDKTASITAAASKTEDFDPQGHVLDDFNDGGISNLFGGDTDTFTDAGKSGSCNFSNDSLVPYEGMFCLKLDYNVSIFNAYAGYSSSLESKNLSAYSFVSFWVKGVSGGEFFKIEFWNNSADSNRNHAAVYIKDYLDGGVTTNWQKVTVPFHNFVNLDDWTSMNRFTITFENFASNTNGSPKQGSIYIDEISFSSESVTTVRIDHFGDKLAPCALGGGMGNMPNEYPTIPYSKYSFSTTQYLNSQNGLFSEYNVNADPGWAGIWLLFGGGNEDRKSVV